MVPKSLLFFPHFDNANFCIFSVREPPTSVQPPAEHSKSMADETQTPSLPYGGRDKRRVLSNPDPCPAAKKSAHEITPTIDRSTVTAKAKAASTPLFSDTDSPQTDLKKAAIPSPGRSPIRNTHGQHQQFAEQSVSEDYDVSPSAVAATSLAEHASSHTHGLVEVSANKSVSENSSVSPSASTGTSPTEHPSSNIDGQDKTSRSASVPETADDVPWEETIEVGLLLLCKFKDTFHKATVLDILHDEKGSIGRVFVVQYFNPIKSKKIRPVKRSIGDLRKLCDLPPASTNPELRKANRDEVYQIGKGSIVFVRLFKKSGPWYPAEIMEYQPVRNPAQAKLANRRARLLHNERAMISRRIHIFPVFENSPMQLNSDGSDFWPHREKKMRIDPNFRFGKRTDKEIYDDLELRQYQTGKDMGVDRNPEYDCERCAEPLDSGSEKEMRTKLCEDCWEGQADEDENRREDENLGSNESSKGYERAEEYLSEDAEAEKGKTAENSVEDDANDRADETAEGDVEEDKEA